MLFVLFVLLVYRSEGGASASPGCFRQQSIAEQWQVWRGAFAITSVDGLYASAIRMQTADGGDNDNDDDDDDGFVYDDGSS